MTTTPLIAGAVAAATVVTSILANIELWQRKEYRYDRVRAYLRSSEISFTTLPFFTIGMVLAAIGWVALSNKTLLPVGLLGWVSLFSFAAHYGLPTLRRGVSRPVFTVKAIANLTLVGVIALALLYRSRLLPLTLATIIFFIPFITPFTVGLINFPTWLTKRSLISRARQQRSCLAALTVIGITGSFGKTSTKHFLYQLLKSAGKHVLATAEHRNAEFPVAQDMLARLTPATELYIVEAGAYHVGEIAAVARLTQPRFGILTTIGNQHLDLFGSLANIISAKWELILSLPSDGLAILNADDPKQVIQAVAQPPRCPIIWYSRQQPKDVWVEKTVIRPASLTARLHVKSEMADIELPLASEASLQSMLAALAALHGLGLPLAALIPHLSSLQPYPRTMEVKTNSRGATIIDDSYTANEVGVLLALRHLQRFSQPHKFVVLVPLIELGHESKAVHERIGAAIATSGAHAYVYGRGEVAALQAGATQTDSYFHIHHYNNPFKLAAKLKEHLSPESVVLLEGRLPDVVRETVL